MRTMTLSAIRACLRSPLAAVIEDCYFSTGTLSLGLDRRWHISPGGQGLWSPMFLSEIRPDLIKDIIFLCWVPCSWTRKVAHTFPRCHNSHIDPYRSRFDDVDRFLCEKKISGRLTVGTYTIHKKSQVLWSDESCFISSGIISFVRQPVNRYNPTDKHGGRKVLCSLVYAALCVHR